MSRFAQALRNLLPRTGRMLTERGTFVNEADILERMDVGGDPGRHADGRDIWRCARHRPRRNGAGIRHLRHGHNGADRC